MTPAWVIIGLVVACLGIVMLVAFDDEEGDDDGHW